MDSERTLDDYWREKALQDERLAKESEEIAKRKERWHAGVSRVFAIGHGFHTNKETRDRVRQQIEQRMRDTGLL